MIDKEVPITNFSEKANAYRNAHRPNVDKLFAIKASYEEKLLALLEDEVPDNEKIKVCEGSIRYFDRKARQIWREVVTKANKL